MATFKTPKYSKTLNQITGTIVPCYTFDIEWTTSNYLSFVAYNSEDISAENVQRCVLETPDWWNSFINNFLKDSAKFFSKPYRLETINKIAKHYLIDKYSADIQKYPVNILLIPNNIQISGVNFVVNWGYTVEQIVIPDLDEASSESDEGKSLPDLVEQGFIKEIEELDIDKIPNEIGCTDTVLEIDSPAKFYEKQRVKEARLKAKLAVYKAQRQMAHYYEKYGDVISDSESESDSDSD
jgi:hypothetical protein